MPAWTSILARCGRPGSLPGPVSPGSGSPCPLGEQVARAGRLGLQFAAQLGQVGTQVVALGLVRGAPYLLEQLALGDQAPAVAHQDLQQLPLGRDEPDVPAAESPSPHQTRHDSPQPPRGIRHVELDG
jgi:hypothetical protein